MLSNAVMKGFQDKCALLEEAIENKDKIIEQFHHDQEMAN